MPSSRSNPSRRTKKHAKQGEFFRFILAIELGLQADEEVAEEADTELGTEDEVVADYFFLADDIAELGFVTLMASAASAWVIPWWAMVSRIRAAAGFESGFGIIYLQNPATAWFGVLRCS